MNSFKSTITVLFLLGVSYGVYRLIHTPDPTATGNGSFFVALGPATPNVDSNNLVQNPLVAPTAKSSDMMTPPAPQSFEAPKIPLIEAPKLATQQPTPPSLYAPRTNNLAGSPSNPPSAKLIPTENDASQSIAAGGSADSESSKTILAGGGAVMSGPLSKVGPGESTAKANGIESLPSLRSNGAPNAPSAKPTELKPNAPLSPEMTTGTPAQDLKSVWPIVDAQVRKGEIATSLGLLSKYYHANLSDAERAELLKWLDALAFKVIYSTEHRLSPTPHIVKEGETIESIAKDWNIPQELLLNINRSKIPPTNVLTAGLELKIVRGPFRAEIDSQRKELTLFLDRCYAGRFPIDTSKCAGLTPGQLNITNLRADPSGQYRLDLAGGISLCAGPATEGTAGIQMNIADAKDVFGILSANSHVTVIR